MKNEIILELFWNDIPTSKKNAVSYSDLKTMWNCEERTVRAILHRLSCYDNGDNYVLIRSARNKGFYKTDDLAEIAEYKQECLNKGKSLFAPIKKINRVISAGGGQFHIENNLRVIRESKGLTQAVVCAQLQQFDKAIDKSMLSKFENGVCLPTPLQLHTMARIYECNPSDMLNGDIFI